MQAAQSPIEQFGSKIREEIRNKTIRLPSLPDVALRVKKAVEAESSADEIARLIAQDAAMTGRIIQVANSALYRGAAEVETVKVSIMRLGTNMVKNLVIGLAIRHLFTTRSAVLASCFQHIWEDSTEIAAISQILAGDLPGIEPEEALLGGLLHNIGALPVLAKLNEFEGATFDERMVMRLLGELSPTLGTEILRSWQLSDELVAIPAGCQDLQRDLDTAVDLVDVVAAARIQHLLTSGKLSVSDELAQMPALVKLGIQVEEVVLEDESNSSWAKQLRSALAV